MAHTTDNASARAILLRMGVGDFNATLIIPMMFYGPAQTDPDITASKVLVKHMQSMMQQMGASFVRLSHRLDQPTGWCLQALAGPRWTEAPWFDLCVALLDARAAGKKFQMRGAADRGSVELSGLGLFSELPDLPGGPFVLAGAAYLAYRYFKKKGR